MVEKTLASIDKPHKKLLQEGEKSLSDAELVACLLGSGPYKKDLPTIVQNALEHFGSLHKLLHAEREEFCALSGMGEARYACLRACIELVQRSLFGRLSKEDITINFAGAREYLSLRLRKKKEEVFSCLFLDSKRSLIAYEEMFVGSINSINIHPRTIIKRALHFNAAAVIVAHNHPSGCSEPSHSDKQMTQELKHSLGMVDVCLLDHFVIGDTVTSFVEEDLL
ncbi:MAG: RadC family protein [Candidatus Oxydemutatoraceae bacterium WSBS_2016_MAG_OTU14]